MVVIGLVAAGCLTVAGFMVSRWSPALSEPSPKAQAMDSERYVRLLFSAPFAFIGVGLLVGAVLCAARALMPPAPGGFRVRRRNGTVVIPLGVHAPHAWFFRALPLAGFALFIAVSLVPVSLFASGVGRAESAPATVWLIDTALFLGLVASLSLAGHLPGFHMEMSPSTLVVPAPGGKRQVRFESVNGVQCRDTPVALWAALAERAGNESAAVANSTVELLVEGEPVPVATWYNDRSTAEEFRGWLERLIAEHLQVHTRTIPTNS
jgi:hypothetical protein